MNNADYSENPTAKVLMRFAAKQDVDVQEFKKKQSAKRKEISEGARALTSAAQKEAKKQEQLTKARNARSKKEE